MKQIIIVILGIAIWSLSLIWPEVNRSLTTLVTVALIGFGGVILLALRKRDQPNRHSKAKMGPHNGPHANTGPSRPINPHDTGPMRPLGAT